MLEKRKDGERPVHEIKCLRISKKSGKRQTDRSCSETLRFSRVDKDLLVETDFYIYRINLNSILNMVVNS
jgi:hypothetical protein